MPVDAPAHRDVQPLWTVLFMQRPEPLLQPGTRKRFRCAAFRGGLRIVELAEVHDETVCRLAPRRKSASDGPFLAGASRDRKSTRLNSSHSQISYAVFCLK